MMLNKEQGEGCGHMRGSHRWIAVVLATAGIGWTAMTGCASSASEPVAVLSSTPITTPDPAFDAQLCIAISEFDAAMNGLAQLDVTAVGIEGVRSALQNISAAATKVANTAQGRFTPEAEQLRQAVSSLDNTIAGLGDEANLAANIGAVATGIATVQQDVVNIRNSAGVDCPQLAPPPLSPPPIPAPSTA